MMRRRLWPIAAALVLMFAAAGQAPAQVDVQRKVPCCDTSSKRIVWIGERQWMTFDELAAYCGPILWFSPDEPLLDDLDRPGGIDIPMAFPFETPGAGPVVYYRVRNVFESTEGQSVRIDADDPGHSAFSLENVSAIDLDYFFYYPSEEGLGGHVHDVESVEMKIVVWRQPDCEECRNGISIELVNARAHGVLWYDNTLETDAYSRFPISILVEEGKHASCTDKNGDGYYTPGYDVSQRSNDAWGVRDVMRSGMLFTGGYQSWFAKVRHPEDRVFPPLPGDSAVIQRHVEDGVYAPGYLKYEVRPFPPLAAAEAHDDPSIMRFADKGYYDWPYVEHHGTVETVVDWLSDESFTRSLSVAGRYDRGMGLSFVFPLMLVKNVNEPLSGGWLVNRIYLQGDELKDFGWNVMYTPSASRWLDVYVSAGLERFRRQRPDSGYDWDTAFVSESGFKLRSNISHSPVSFLSKLTDFWGLRLGVRYRGFDQFSEIGYVVEFGAGAF
jgi:hypothetical protein